jgi:transcription-repair coupling factor (superfamily II helicase)
LKKQLTATAHLRISELLERALSNHKSSIQITGCQSPLAVSLLLSQNNPSNFNGLPNVIVVSSFEEAEALQNSLRFFSANIECFILRAFDVSPYSGLYPAPSSSWDRCRFLYWAARPKQQHVFIAPIQSLLQKTVPFYNFHKLCKQFKIDDDLPTNLAAYFVSLGYQAAPVVEDRGQFSIRGGIVDIFSVAENQPIRIELFGDTIESLKYFSAHSQLSILNAAAPHCINLAPVYEYSLTDDNIESVVEKFRSQMQGQKLDHAERDECLRSLTLKNYFPGSEFLLPLCYDKLCNPLDHFSTGLNIYLLDPTELSRAADEFYQENLREYKANDTSLFNPSVESFYQDFEDFQWPAESIHIQYSNLSFLSEVSSDEERIEYRSQALTEFSQLAIHKTPASTDWIVSAGPKINSWLVDGYKIFISIKNQTQIDRLKNILDRLELSFYVAHDADYNWSEWLSASGQSRQKIIILPRKIEETLLLFEEKIIFLRDDDFFGRKQKARSESSYEEFSKNAKRLSFGDLKLQDLVVHVKHGIGVYEGLKIMNVGGVEAEFIQVAYKDKDKLYLPVYRVGQLQKFSGASQTTILDKLGGTGWEKTIVKVKGHLRDIAAELLQLYAKRSEIKRPPFSFDEMLTAKFERDFPFTETNDQLRAIGEIQKDFLSDKPMDRLVCGDVGFGKTEVSMRAAFQAVQNKKQVAVLAPTTVLTFQHLETFKKRFTSFQNDDSKIEIRSLNRFVSAADQKKTLHELKEGKVHILIGTHRLLSKDVVFKDLGLLVIDEEQKFGVTHKEKIKKFKVNVDTLTLSATPIPRTLNMSFTGVRDLSIINTAPVDRLPTRTFVSKFNSEMIRKAMASEIARGGQIYFIHNRVQSIYGVADEIRQIMPDARIKVAHGQMDEHELEAAMLAFFAHEIDVLVCTAIVESGMDVPRANTMFIDQAHMFGLSQLYQLRGRVGRSKARAYCYLLMPKDKKIDKIAQERLKIIQDNSALGSGIKIAQYDLELRGAGNILGDDQSGHVNSVGYEMYMDLLNETLAEAKGEILTDFELDPEVNLKIPALIPDKYIPDIRMRLSYYKALADIKSQDDLDLIETELKDQFGELPEPVINLMGLMLIRRQCKNLGVRDISAGLKNISLIFTSHTKLSPEKAIQLSMRENKKYSLTPDQRLNVRMNVITWSKVYEELNYLLSLV